MGDVMANMVNWLLLLSREEDYILRRRQRVLLLLGVQKLCSSLPRYFFYMDDFKNRINCTRMI